MFQDNHPTIKNLTMEVYECTKKAQASSQGERFWGHHQSETNMTMVVGTRPANKANTLMQIRQKDEPGDCDLYEAAFWGWVRKDTFVMNATPQPSHTREPRRLAFELSYLKLNSRIGSYLFSTIFLHQKARSWNFSGTWGNLWRDWILGGWSNTWLMHMAQRPGHTQPQTLQLLHRLWQQVEKHRTATRGAFGATWSEGRCVSIQQTFRGNSSTQFCPDLLWEPLVWGSSGDFSLLDPLLLGIHLTPAATGIPSPEWTLSAGTWEASKPRGFFYPAEQPWHWLSFPIQISGQPDWNWHNWPKRASGTPKLTLLPWSQQMR